MGAKITKLLAEFQAGHPVAKFDKEGQAGGSRKYGYASYGSVIECLKPLAAKGLAWHHQVNGFCRVGGENVLVVSTFLSHEDEEVACQCEIPMPPNIQTLGSYITYLKRYQLVAMCGMTADEDDDGAAAQSEQTATPAKSRAKAAAAPAESDTLKAAMSTLAQANTSTTRQQFLALANARVKQGKLTSDDYVKLCTKLILMVQDSDELTTGIQNLINVAEEDKSISETDASVLGSEINRRVKQIESVAKIGGRMKAGV